MKKGTSHNALYIGTSDGRVLKLYDPGEGPTTIVESVKVFARNAPVVNLMAADRQVPHFCAAAVEYFPVPDKISTIFQF